MDDIAKLKTDNAEYLWHPMAHPGVLKKAKPAIISKGEGCWIWDVDGHKMLDAVGGLWSNNLGHSCKPVRDAIVAQLDELPFYNVFNGTSHPRAIELSERLVSMMKPDGVSAVTFSSGGSDAVETALKISRQYHKLRGQAERFKFIALRQGYHGVHFGGTSINGTPSFRKPYEPLLSGVSHIDSPWLYRNPYTDNAAELGELCANMLEREIISQGPDSVAAFIAEPVQGAGGVIVPPENFWPKVREVCDRYGVLLIADEVVTGFGRSGKLFGTRLWGVKADIWCLAKGISSGYIPLGATAISQKVAEVFESDETGAGIFGHGYTYSGHPVAAAAALATLDQVELLDLPSNAAKMGAILQPRLRKLVENSSIVGDVRGVGLMAGIEMVADKATKKPLDKTSEIPKRVFQEAYQRGLMTRSAGPNMILSPSLIINEEEVNFICQTLEDSFKAVEETL